MKAKKMNGPNTGIKCQVTSCYYHNPGDQCTAEKIEVKGAGSSQEADCVTFSPKQ
jgi:hypothetical protein